MMMRLLSVRLTWAAWLLVAAMLAGCSSTKPYRSDTPVNLHIRPQQLKSSSSQLISTFSAAMHVGAVDKHCQRSYVGSVSLGSDTPVDIGVPTDHASILVIEFANESRLAAYAAHATVYTTLFAPRPGYQYDMEVAYDRGRYSVDLYERDRRGSRHEVEHRSPNSCVSS